MHSTSPSSRRAAAEACTPWRAPRARTHRGPRIFDRIDRSAPTRSPRRGKYNHCSLTWAYVALWVRRCPRPASPGNASDEVIRPPGRIRAPRQYSQRRSRPPSQAMPARAVRELRLVAAYDSQAMTPGGVTRSYRESYLFDQRSQLHSSEAPLILTAHPESLSEVTDIVAGTRTSDKGPEERPGPPASMRRGDHGALRHRPGPPTDAVGRSREILCQVAQQPPTLHKTVSRAEPSRRDRSLPVRGTCQAARRCLLLRNGAVMIEP